MTAGPAGADDRLVARADPALLARVRDLATRRMVFLAGLPGTGKSLLVHQVSHLARAAGRAIHLLQWDVARPAFEASAAGQRYPVVGGVTHVVVRKAVGLWVRDAVARWNERHAGPEHVLLGETPFVGNRLVELARREDDAAEPLLAAPSCRFVVAVPSVAVRRFLEARREERAARPLHAREREDAPPAVLRDLWRQLAEVARGQGIDATAETYEPNAYRRVYERILRWRHVDTVALDAILPTDRLSVYDFATPPSEVVPTEAEAERFIREVERRSPDVSALERDAARWWVS